MVEVERELGGIKTGYTEDLRSTGHLLADAYGRVPFPICLLCLWKKNRGDSRHFGNALVACVASDTSGMVPRGGSGHFGNTGNPDDSGNRPPTFRERPGAPRAV